MNRHESNGIRDAFRYPCVPTDGSVSAGIYDAVQKLTADGKMTRATAVKPIAKETGRKAGTVSANYYYVARKRGEAAEARWPRPGRWILSAAP